MRILASTEEAEKMKLEKAIEILTHPPFYPSTPNDKEYTDAINLGIEALRVIKDVRPTDYGAIDDPLLGETEE